MSSRGRTGVARLGDSSWTEVAAAPGRVLAVPVGSCEQHGPHLPIDTDTRIAVAICERAAARGAGVVVAPPIAFGASGEHQGFAGTLSIGTDALRTVLVELGRSALAEPRASDAPFGALVLVNGHGGNHESVTDAVGVLVGEGRVVSAWWPRLGGDAHAGRTETSLLLAIAPDAVGPDRPVGETTPIAELLPRLRDGGVAAVSASGVLGDATGATAAEGERLLDSAAADLVAHLTRVSDTS